MAQLDRNNVIKGSQEDTTIQYQVQSQLNQFKLDLEQGGVRILVIFVEGGSVSICHCAKNDKYYH